MQSHKIFMTSFASVYPLYIAKAERKGRTKAEVDEIIYWLTGFDPEGLEDQLTRRADFQTFFADAPHKNPARALIKGVICGLRVEMIEEPVMREIRYLDKLIDELANGEKMEKILRKDQRGSRIDVRPALACGVIQELAEFLRTTTGNRDLLRPFHSRVARRQLQHRKTTTESAAGIDVG